MRWIGRVKRRIEKMTTNEKLKEILERHKKWLAGESGGKRADLRGANLRDANLRDTDLERANLRGADLSGADLSDANLRGADLSDAYLGRANLRGADLSGADLSDADLRGADLSDAYLGRANLRGTNLRGADLRGANLDYSCWPLWCGSIDVKIDKRIAAQLAYHFCRLDCDDPEYLAARAALAGLANKFHRVDECGVITED